jgi:hypothetical protein
MIREQRTSKTKYAVIGSTKKGRVILGYFNGRKEARDACGSNMGEYKLSELTGRETHIDELGEELPYWLKAFVPRIS